MQVSAFLTYVITQQILFLTALDTQILFNTTVSKFCCKTNYLENLNSYLMMLNTVLVSSGVARGWQETRSALGTMEGGIQNYITSTESIFKLFFNMLQFFNDCYKEYCIIYSAAVSISFAGT